MRARLFVDFGLWKPCVYARNVNISEVAGIETLKALLAEFTKGKAYITLEDKR